MRSTQELNQDFVLMFNMAKRMARKYRSLGTTDADSHETGHQSQVMGHRASLRYGA